MRCSYQPGLKVAHVTSTKSRWPTLSHLIDCPNFREARRCSLAVNPKGRENVSSEQLVSTMRTKSCDSLEPMHK